MELRGYSQRVEPRDVDFRKRATIMALGDYILHVAGEDADRNGFGVRELNEKHNSSWVLTRMAMEVTRMPDEYEMLRIETWVSEVTRIMTTRNFNILGADGKPVAACVTNWAMIDLTTRRPLDLHSLERYDSMTQDVPHPIEKPARLETPAESSRHSHTVVYSDVDFNCHANSMKYVQWVVDTLPLALLEERIFARMDINFIQESRHGQQLSIIAGTAEAANGDVDCRYEIRNSDDKAICRISFSLR